jgi:hypothetical protein
MKISPLGIDKLDLSTRAAIAEFWAAPSVQPSVLERFLLTPLHVARRVESLSLDAREDLVALVEATRATIPVDAVRPEAVAELRDNLLVLVADSPTPTVTLPMDVAVASMDTLGATPCRLRLLLHQLDAAKLHKLHTAVAGVLVSDPTMCLAPQRTRELARWLSDVGSVAAIAKSLKRRSASQLWELVAAGGTTDRAICDIDTAVWIELAEHGLVWTTEVDVRVPTETLQALLQLRLHRRIHQACGRWTQLLAAVQHDNVCPFPGPPLPADTLALLMEGLITEPTLPGIGSASRAIFGPDAPDGSVYADDVTADEALCAIAPHLLDAGDGELPAATASQSMEILRILLQQLLSSIPVGALVTRADLESAVDALGGVARDLVRVMGPAYVRDPREPLPAELQAGVEAWLRAGPIKLGWVQVGDTEPANAPDPGGNLSLFPTRPRERTPACSPTVRIVMPPPAMEASARRSIRHLATPVARWLEPLLLYAGDRRRLPTSDISMLPEPERKLRRQLQDFLADADEGDANAIDKVRDFIVLHSGARSLEDVTDTDITGYLLWWMRRVLRSRSIGAIRSALSGLDALSLWARERGIVVGFDATSIRKRHEGALLRTASAETAFLAHPRRRPPPGPRAAPDRAHRGHAHVVDLRASDGLMTLEMAPGLEISRFCVAADPRPLALLRPGDVIVGSFVRFGAKWWLTALDGVHPQGAPTGPRVPIS